MDPEAFSRGRWVQPCGFAAAAAGLTLARRGGLPAFSRPGVAPRLRSDPASMSSNVLIIDFGSQVTQLIARRVREAGIYCEIHPFQNAEAAFAKLKPAAVILSGGPSSV